MNLLSLTSHRPRLLSPQYLIWTLRRKIRICGYTDAKCAHTGTPPTHTHMHSTPTPTAPPPHTHTQTQHTPTQAPPTHTPTHRPPPPPPPTHTHRHTYRGSTESAWVQRSNRYIKETDGDCERESVARRRLQKLLCLRPVSTSASITHLHARLDPFHSAANEPSTSKALC